MILVFFLFSGSDSHIRGVHTSAFAEPLAVTPVRRGVRGVSFVADTVGFAHRVRWARCRCCVRERDRGRNEGSVFACASVPVCVCVPGGRGSWVWCGCVRACVGRCVCVCAYVCAGLGANPKLHTRFDARSAFVGHSAAVVFERGTEGAKRERCLC